MLSLVVGMPGGNRRMLSLMRVLFFLQSWSPLGMLKAGTLYLLDRGMTVQQIGAIEAVTLFAPALTNPLMGVVADRLRRRKAVSVVAMAASIVILAVLAVPQIGCKRCFWRILGLMTVLSCASLGGTVDAYTLDFLGPSRKGEYGKYRLWGSVGWASSATSAGLVMTHLGFAYNFPIYGLTGALMLALCVGCLPKQTLSELSREGGDASALSKPAPPASLRAALCRWRVLLALCEVAVLGFGVGVAEKLIFAYVVNELGGSPALCGYGVACMSATNIPLFFLSSRLLRLCGRDALFLVATAAYALRVAAYTRLTHSTVGGAALTPAPAATAALLARTSHRTPHTCIHTYTPTYMAIHVHTHIAPHAARPRAPPSPLLPLHTSHAASPVAEPTHGYIHT